MAYSIESAEQNTFELADAGMTCLNFPALNEPPVR